MKKLFTLVVVSLLLVVLPHSSQVHAKEVLKITQDHFEFRDAPRAADETFIGTLRIDTPVEWTGNVSGKWFEVKAPNGQIGWVHGSGLSRPKSPVEQPKRAEPAPAPSRSTSQPSSSAQVSKLKASVKELEKAKKQYDAQLKEKDRRIQELSEELGQVEEKLSDTGQMLEDQEQLRTLNERKVTEAENQMLALEGTIKEKDEALLTAKVEMTKIENQLQNLRNQQGSPLSADRILLVLSLLVNVLGFLLFLIMRKRLAAARAAIALVKEDGDVHQERLETVQEEQEELDETEAEDALELRSEVSEGQSENDDQMKELDVVMAAPYSEDDADEDGDSGDEVEIDLGDVLPAAAGIAATISDDNNADSEPEDTAPAIMPEAEVIIVEEAIERVEELPEEGPPETENDESILNGGLIVEDAVGETQGSLIEDALELTEEPEVLEALEEADTIPEEEDGSEETIELPEEPEELIELEDIEEAPESPDDTLEDVEELLLEDDQELTSTLSADENEYPEAEVEAIKVSGEHFEKLPQSSTQLIESDGEDESLFDEKSEQPQEVISAEEQEELPHNEEAEENGETDDEMIIGTPGIIDEDDYENETPDFESSSEAEIGDFEAETENNWDEEPLEAVEDLPDADELIEEPSETEAAVAEYSEPEELIGEIEEELSAELPDDEKANGEEPYEFGEVQPEVKEFEVEEIVVIDELDQGVSKALHDEREERGIEEDTLDISSEVEELLELDEASLVIEPKSAPSFLEPSPYLIEPEHEPEESLVPEEEVIEESLDEPEEERGYAIELLDAGSNTESVVHVLSKVNGLLASPSELVERTPCLIAKGAGKSDAEGFQLIMQKLGAKVRLHSQG